MRNTKIKKFSLESPDVNSNAQFLETYTQFLETYIVLLWNGHDTQTHDKFFKKHTTCVLDTRVGRVSNTIHVSNIFQTRHDFMIKVFVLHRRVIMLLLISVKSILRVVCQAFFNSFIYTKSSQRPSSGRNGKFYWFIKFQIGTC